MKNIQKSYNPRNFTATNAPTGSEVRSPLGGTNSTYVLVKFEDKRKGTLNIVVDISKNRIYTAHDFKPLNNKTVKPCNGKEIAINATKGYSPMDPQYIWNNAVKIVNEAHEIYLQTQKNTEFACMLPLK